MNQPTYFVVLASACVTAGGATGCRESAGGPASDRGPVPVRVAEVALRQFASEVVALGNLRARESVEVTANVTEKVYRVRFRDGQTVEAGQILVELVRDEELSRLDEARAALSNRRSELARVEALAEDAIATASELDARRTDVRTAEANLQTIEAQLGDRLVRAPFAGIVGLRRVSPGSLVTPNTTITTLDAIDILYADLPVPERYVSQVAAGQSVSLTSDAYPDDTFVGKVLAVDGRIDPLTRAVTVRAEILNRGDRLRPGMLVRGELSVGERASPAVPETAVVQRAYRSFVYTVVAQEAAAPKGQSKDNGKGPAPSASEAKAFTVGTVDIETGRRQPGWVEVTAGLEVGETVVIEGLNRVVPGKKVTVVGGEPTH